MPRGRPTGRAGIVNTGRGFTYDFGIAIAAGTVRQLQLLTGTALGLTTAIYGLSRVTSEYVDTLKQNSLFFGGQLRTMKAMKFVQDQLLKGQTEFFGDDILQGMRLLKEVGVDAVKSFKFISDAAEATGQSFSQFAGAVNSAIQGNMGGLVQMGLLTHRAARVFDKFYANTVQRQQAILNFIQQHKGLQAAIRNSFSTITGQWRRLIENVKLFFQSIMGNPKDPSSLYGQIVSSIKGIADWLNRHSRAIRKTASFIGSVLGWVIRQVYHFIRFVGRQFGKVLGWMDAHTQNFREKIYSMLLWLELWKVHIIAFFKRYRQEIIFALKVIAGFIIFRKVLGLVSAGMYGLGKALRFATFGFNLTKSLLPGLTMKFSKIKWAFLEIRAAAIVAGNQTLRYAKTAGSSLLGLPGKIGKGFKYVTSDAFLLSPFKKIIGLGKGIWNIFAGGGGLLGILKRLGAAALGIFRTFGGWFGWLGRIVGIGARFVPIWGWVLSIVILIVANFKKVWPVIYNIGATIWNIGVILAKKIVESVKWVIGGFDKVWDGVKKIGQAMWNWFPDWLKNTITWVVDKVSWLWDKIKGIGQAISKFFGFAADKTAEMAGDLGLKSYGSKDSPTAPQNTTDHTGGAANPFQGVKENNPLIPEDMGSPYSDEEMAKWEKEMAKWGASVSVRKGAVTIVVQKGDHIDEAKLARMLERVLPDLVRKAKIMAGK